MGVYNECNDCQNWSAVSLIHTISCQTSSIFLHYHWIWTVGVDVQNYTIFVHILNNCKIIWQMILPKVLKWQRILPCRQTNWKQFSMKKHAVPIGPAAILCTIWPSHLDSTELKNMMVRNRNLDFEGTKHAYGLADSHTVPLDRVLVFRYLTLTGYTFPGHLAEHPLE